MKGKKREIDYGRNVDKKIREKLFEIFCHRILNTILIITISVGLKKKNMCYTNTYSLLPNLHVKSFI